MASRGQPTRRVIAVTPTLAIAGIVLLVAGILATRPTSVSLPTQVDDKGAGAVASTTIDIPPAPDYFFEPVAVADVPALEPSAVVARARESLPSDVVGKAPIVRFVSVRARTINYGPIFVVFSADAGPILLIGDGVQGDPTAPPPVATYSWVFITPTGEFIGASRQDFPKDPPPVPAQ